MDLSVLEFRSFGGPYPPNVWGWVVFQTRTRLMQSSTPSFSPKTSERAEKFLNTATEQKILVMNNYDTTALDETR